MTAIYSVLHMLVDGVCALAMFGRFFVREDWHFALLLYNFCAFALQMPIGVVLDLLQQKEEAQAKVFAHVFAILGVIVTLLGAFVHPVVLGIGNALFHIGGGVGTIYEDREKGWNGKGLGVFVAPGAFGLYLGTLAAKQGWMRGGLIVAVVLVVAGCLVAEGGRKKSACGADYVGVTMEQGRNEEQKEKHSDKKYGDAKHIILAAACFLVVILRSYIGMAVRFPWKQVPILGLCSVLVVVGGKVAGGFAGARVGYRKTAVVSLLLAALGYLGMNVAPIGLAALFFFNMTMPITLYLLICTYPKLPGFSFGLLTFGLFLGFLPSYLEVELPVTGQILGSVGSLISLVLLLTGMMFGGQREHVSD